MNYKDSGVDVERGYRAVALMKRHVARTMNRQVLGGIGSFGGMYSLEGIAGDRPVLVSGADGVGTKLKIAFALDKHDTIGIDCVAMCVNDVICQGARPLFFLDYIATARSDPEKIAAIVSGVAEGCVQAGCALVGGETAEMPGMYAPGEYDMAGFCVGLAQRDALIDGSRVRPGHAVVGLFSSGVHSNGFSLIRRLFGEDAAALSQKSDDLGMTWGEALLTPTRIYVKSVLELIATHPIDGAAHITGGGLIENLPRMLPEGTRIRLIPRSWQVPFIFDEMGHRSGMSRHDLYNTFNMGIGMALAVPAGAADAVLRAALSLEERAAIIGEVIAGESGVDLP